MKNSEIKERPRIICHMMTSLDGKIHGAYMNSPVTRAVDWEFERANDSYNPDAWLCGRVTTEENFTDYHKPDVRENAPQVPEGDYIANANAAMYYVSIDRLGKVGWQSNSIHYMKRPEAHIIEVLSEKTSNGYRDLLRRLNISYIIAGKEYIDCLLTVQKLKVLFGIDTLMLSGGGYINGSFLSEGLIDELKIRASFGASGNKNIGNYQAFGLLSQSNAVINNKVTPGYTQISSENKDLGWERTYQYNGGFDLGMSQDFLNFVKTTTSIDQEAGK